MRSHRNRIEEAILRLGSRVARRRKSMRLTQTEVAALAECSELFVRELEKGKSTVRLDKAISVLAAVGFELQLVNGPSGLAVGDE